MVDVPLLGDPELARQAAYAWAGDVWMAWHEHTKRSHDWI